MSATIRHWRNKRKVNLNEMNEFKLDNKSQKQRKGVEIRNVEIKHFRNRCKITKENTKRQKGKNGGETKDRRTRSNDNNRQGKNNKQERKERGIIKRGQCLAWKDMREKSKQRADTKKEKIKQS